MSQSGTSRISAFVIILAVISIPIILLDRSIGLTILFVSMLLYAGVYVRDRLRILGAERFAIGSILVWLGFLLGAFPVIAFAWDLYAVGTRILLFVLGIFLIIMGFTAEYFNLNVAFVNFLRNTYARLLDAWYTIRSRIFRSVFTVFSLIFALLAIFFLVMPSNWLSIFTPLTRISLFGISIGISLVSLGIEFRSILSIASVAIVKFFSFLIHALIKRIAQIRGLVVKLYQLLVEGMRRVASSFYQALQFVSANLYIVSSVGFIATLYGGLSTSNQILTSIALLLLLLTLLFTLNQRQTQLADGISRLQQSTYRQSFKIRNRLSSPASGLCPSCNSVLDPKRRYCSNCNTFIPACMVCNMPIYKGEEVLVCPYCQSSGHTDHVESWMEIRPICPHCRESWAEIIQR